MLTADPVIAATADACAVIRAERSLLAHHTHCKTTYAAKSWGRAKRRVIARIEATTLGPDIRTIVTSIQGSTPERRYEFTFTYCDRGRVENPIKLHKTQLKSDRTSCTTAAANQMRLILRTAACWLLWTVQQAIPQKAPLKRAEFTTLRIHLVKIGARIIETASRIRTAIASACPDKALIAHLVRSLGAPTSERPRAPWPHIRFPPRTSPNATQPQKERGKLRNNPAWLTSSGPTKRQLNPSRSNSVMNNSG